MGDAPLVVNIDKQAELEKMHDFFAATPLANPLADIFNVVQGQGLASANIELLIGSQFELSQLIFLWVVIKCIRGGEKAAAKPWERAEGLEWR